MNVRIASKVLGLKTSNLTLAAVTTAFRTLARDLHPDKGGTTEQFQLLNQAHSYLLKTLDDSDEVYDTEHDSQSSCWTDDSADASVRFSELSYGSDTAPEESFADVPEQADEWVAGLPGDSAHANTVHTSVQVVPIDFEAFHTEDQLSDKVERKVTNKSEKVSRNPSDHHHLEPPATAPVASEESAEGKSDSASTATLDEYFEKNEQNYVNDEGHFKVTLNPTSAKELHERTLREYCFGGKNPSWYTAVQRTLRMCGMRKLHKGLKKTVFVQESIVITVPNIFRDERTIYFNVPQVLPNVSSLEDTVFRLIVIAHCFLQESTPTFRMVNIMREHFNKYD